MVSWPVNSLPLRSRITETPRLALAELEILQLGFGLTAQTSNWVYPKPPTGSVVTDDAVIMRRDMRVVLTPSWGLGA